MTEQPGNQEYIDAAKSNEQIRLTGKSPKWLDTIMVLLYIFGLIVFAKVAFGIIAASGTASRRLLSMDFEYILQLFLVGGVFVALFLGISAVKNWLVRKFSR